MESAYSFAAENWGYMFMCHWVFVSDSKPFPITLEESTDKCVRGVLLVLCSSALSD